MQHSVEDEWDMEIGAASSWYDLKLNELWQYRDLVLLFVKRDFVAAYKQTILGPLWFLIQPIAQTLVMSLVFGGIALIPTDGSPRPLFYLSGVVCWGYFSSCLTKTANTFVYNAGVFGKVYFPRLTVPISVVISNLFAFLIQFCLFLVFMGIYHFKGVDVHLTVFAFLLPVLLLIMGLMGLAFGLIVSSLTTKYRDLALLVAFGVQLLMYAAPVVYPLKIVSEKYKPFVQANPMTAIIEAFRKGFMGTGEVTLLQLGYSSVFTLVILLFGVLIFNRIEKTFIDTV
ncbi:MAG: ABC transporter permease [Bacteroidia bacterium]